MLLALLNLAIVDHAPLSRRGTERGGPGGMPLVSTTMSQIDGSIGFVLDEKRFDWSIVRPLYT